MKTEKKDNFIRREVTMQTLYRKDAFNSFLKYLLISFVICMVILVGLTIYTTEKNEIEKSLTEINCCDGFSCSDTYYNPETNNCYLTMCKAIIKDSSCIYKGKNITTIEGLMIIGK